MEKKDELIEKDDLPDFEDEVTAQVEQGLIEIEDAGSADSSSSIPELSVEEPAASVPEEVAPLEEVAPADPVPAPADDPFASTPQEAPRQEYGAPQMLFEDIIPSEYRRSEPTPEPTPEPEEPKPEKKEKKKSKADELIEALEEEMKSRQSAAEQESAFDAVEPTPVAPNYEVLSTETKQEPVMKSTSTPIAKEFSETEQQLRRNYKMENDILLAGNSAVPGFVIAKGENVIRAYDCLACSRGTGSIYLTNKRLLINADECAEVEINKITGIKFSRYWTFSILKLIFGLIFAGLGIFMALLAFFHSGMNIPGITGDSWKDWFPYLFIGCGLVSILLSLPFFLTLVKKYFYFNLFTQEDKPFFEVKSPAYVKRESKGKVYKYVVANSNKVAEKAARELGALIIEAKDGRYDF